MTMVFSTHCSNFSLSNLAKRKKLCSVSQHLHFLLPSRLQFSSHLSIPLELLLLNSPMDSTLLNQMHVSKPHYHDLVTFDTGDYPLLLEILSNPGLHDTTIPRFVPISVIYLLGSLLAFPFDFYH